MPLSKDKIVKYLYNEENRDIIENEESLPEDGIVVCQSEDIPDILSSETNSYINGYGAERESINLKKTQ